MNYLSGDAGVPKGIALANLVGDVVAFVPLGVFLPLLRRSAVPGSNLLIALRRIVHRWSRRAVVIAALSLLAAPALLVLLFGVGLRM